MTKLTAFCALLIVSTAVPAVYADSLEEKKYWKEQFDQVNEKIKLANEQCGTSFTFDWRDKPKLRSESEKHKATPSGVCGVLVENVEMVCRSGDDGKHAVKAKIRGFTCGYLQPHTLDMNKGIVTYMGNLEEPNINDWMRPWLEKHL